ncbi:nuclear transport factor 2 family protein [Salimicrobium halophilum]|uniref:DUF4440 domain-containing protein n=1 Tax=Salimicrobium halophilum TaxID=86666 RepID=A0A1G8RHD3_9BACI|nr:DUF4440 domain-containing protein [Salimicrobium halophilum]SDJ16406.1 hypothetical protein SAMN04490247_1036 [Salimicrobium halophilum]
MEDQAKVKEEIYSLESTLLKGDIRKSAGKLDELLAEDFIEYSSTGEIYDKVNILDRLPAEDDPGITMSDFEVKHLSPTSVLSTFKIFIESKQKHSLRSSVWTYENGKWRMTFHQGTVMD